MAHRIHAGPLAQLDFLGGDRTLASGWTSPYLTHHRVFPTASDATETLRAGWKALATVLDGRGRRSGWNG